MKTLTHHPSETCPECGTQQVYVTKKESTVWKEANRRVHSITVPTSRIKTTTESETSLCGVMIGRKAFTRFHFHSAFQSYLSLDENGVTRTTAPGRTKQPFKSTKVMSNFDVDTEDITVFKIGSRYLFTTYFEEEPLYNHLKKYYNNDKYRFEIPEEDLNQVRQILDEFYYKLTIEDNLEDYLVAVDKEADSSSILRNSVMREHQGHHEIYVMKDKLSVKQAIEDGATEIKKSEVDTEELTWKTDGS